MTVDEERPIVKRALIFGVVSVVVGVMLPILTIVLPWRPEGEPVESWFQRSGSVMVIVAVWAEVKLSGIYSALNPTGWITEDGDVLRNEYGSYYKWIVGLVAVVAVVGTLIWGYGDLIIANT
jgi:hypothetical protein